MTEEHGAYDHPVLPEPDGVEHIGAILHRLAQQHPWGQLLTAPADAATRADVKRVKTNGQRQSHG